MEYSKRQIEVWQLIGYEAAAEMLGIAPVTLRKWVMKGRIPAKKLGKRIVRFDPRELREWIDEHSISVSKKGRLS